ncbi:MAG: domain, repeat-containing protein [Thermoleophilia bacterium]|nr:domain, repeat-containing protein [Thermoleophilia bacterium]
MWSLPRGLIGAVAITAVLAVVGAANGMQFSSWATAQKIDEIGGNSTELNTAAVDGCPIQSPDGLSLYMASSRPGGQGNLDIWVATRESTGASWGAPQNLTAINTAADEFCPTPVRGNGLFFVSRKVVTGVTCGLGDIYFTRRNPVHGWSEPQHFACAPDGPNTVLDEQGPSRVTIDGTEYLYFSSSRAAAQPGGLVNGDIYVSERVGDGFGPGVAVAGLNEAAANDIQPNVRKDGLEVVFSSNRGGGGGLQDIWVATRESTNDPWSAPFNLGSAVNTTASETRPSLSWNADQLLFGRQAPNYAGEGGTGMTDIYVAKREKLEGGGS